jgi:hypothetical protein
MDDSESSETIIARERDHFVRITVHEKLTFAPFNRLRSTKAKDRITQQQYNELRGDKPILDSSEAPAMRRTPKDRENLRARLWIELLATAPICSICQTPMKFKKSKNGPFWGCRIYPKCLSNSSFSVTAQAAFERWQNA